MSSIQYFPSRTVRNDLIEVAEAVIVADNDLKSVCKRLSLINREARTMLLEASAGVVHKLHKPANKMSKNQYLLQQRAHVALLAQRRLYRTLSSLASKGLDWDMLLYQVGAVMGDKSAIKKLITGPYSKYHIPSKYQSELTL